MRRALVLSAIFLASGCKSEPLRPMAPELDPASSRAPAAPYQTPPNPLAAEVPDAAAGGGMDAPAMHHHHHDGHDGGGGAGGGA